jgi:hypothetical protein
MSKLLEPKRGEHPIWYIRYLSISKGLMPLEFQKAAGLSDRELVWELSKQGIITMPIARGLVKVFGRTTDFWVNLSLDYFNAQKKKLLNFNKKEK